MAEPAPAPIRSGPDLPHRPSRWGDSDRFVPTRMVQPLQRLLATESAGGMVIVAAALVALVWANSPWHGAYRSLWTTPFGLRLGPLRRPRPSPGGPGGGQPGRSGGH